MSRDRKLIRLILSLLGAVICLGIGNLLLGVALILHLMGGLR